ncbi:MAG: PLD nuclease N-terminal domain-containing protein [Marmoricola sp.]
MATKKSWSDLSPTQQKAIMAAGAAEAVITAVALIDLVRRPKTRVRGPKVLWVAAFAVQPVGPLAYLKKGRRVAAPQAA